MVEQRKAEPGTELFREGEPARQVAYLISGEVEVTKGHDGRQVVLGRVGAGEFVGEMGVLEGRARMASVRAVTPVTYELLDGEQFLERVSTTKDLALRTLRRLSERLRRADERLAGLLAEGQAEPSQGTDLRLLPASETLAAQLPADGILITSFPFEVGRRPGGGEQAPSHKVDCALEDHRPYRLSRQHFTILRTASGFAVADAGSALGTVVNGLPLGEDLPQTRADLMPGTNTVVAGGEHSPFVFKLVQG